MPTNEATLKPSGVAMVSSDHIRLAQARARRGANFSASHPAGT
jgi:hypothetical protein